LEAFLDVVGCYSIEMDGFKSDKKLGLDNVVDMSFDEDFEFSAI